MGRQDRLCVSRGYGTQASKRGGEGEDEHEKPERVLTLSGVPGSPAPPGEAQGREGKGLCLSHPIASSRACQRPLRRYTTWCTKGSRW